MKAFTRKHRWAMMVAGGVLAVLGSAMFLAGLSLVGGVMALHGLWVAYTPAVLLGCGGGSDDPGTYGDGGISGD